jgi:hypothetical protein
VCDSPADAGADGNTPMTDAGAPDAGSDVDAGPPPLDVCGLGITTASEACSVCLNTYCCAAFTVCVADSTCQACLDNGAAPGCSSNLNYTTTTSCISTECPTVCAF